MYKKYNPGFIEVITGCMFAGKTQELIRILSTLKYSKMPIIVFKHSIDNRYSTDEIASHFGNKLSAINISNPLEIYKHNVDKYDIVAFDEVQFFNRDIIDVVKDLANKGKRVIVAGLDQDFKGEPFGPMPELLSLAEFVIKLSAICQVCGIAGTKTQRLINGKPAKYDDPIVLVGATDSYEARCRSHHIIQK